MAAARRARNRLPDRPRCPRCHTQFSPVVLRASMSGASDVVIVTESCKQLTPERRRCGQPFAVMVRKDQPTEYLHAATFAELDRVIIDRVKEL